MVVKLSEKKLDEKQWQLVMGAFIGINAYITHSGTHISFTLNNSIVGWKIMIVDLTWGHGMNASWFDKEGYDEYHIYYPNLSVCVLAPSLYASTASWAR